MSHTNIPNDYSESFGTFLKSSTGIILQYWGLRPKFQERMTSCRRNQVVFFCPLWGCPRSCLLIHQTEPPIDGSDGSDDSDCSCVFLCHVCIFPAVPLSRWKSVLCQRKPPWPCIPPKAYIKKAVLLWNCKYPIQISYWFFPFFYPCVPQVVLTWNCKFLIHISQMILMRDQIYITKAVLVSSCKCPTQIFQMILLRARVYVTKAVLMSSYKYLTQIFQMTLLRVRAYVSRAVLPWNCKCPTQISQRILMRAQVYVRKQYRGSN